MKRFIPALILVLAAITLFAGVASAALKMGPPQPLGWKNESTWNVPGAPGAINFVGGLGSRDTLYKQIKVGATDTTAWISTSGWAIPENAVADSIVIGYLWCQTDSTAAGSFTATSFTITPQFMVQNGSTAASADLNVTSGPAVTFTDVTSGEKMFKFPIILGMNSRGTLTGSGWPAPQIRYLIVAIGGVVSPARLWVSHLY